jgi:hypothetical protein
MAALKANIVVAQSNNALIIGSKQDDLLFLTTSSNQGYVFGPSNANSVLTIRNNGNIGVGISNPGYPLDVVGDVNITGNFRQNGVIFSGGNGIGFSNFGSNLFVNSNVGIGKSNPVYTLDVLGDINLSGSLRQDGIIFTGGGNGIGFSNFDSNLFTFSNIGISKSNPSYSLDIVGDINITGNFRQNGNLFAGGGGGTAVGWIGAATTTYTNCNVGIGVSTPFAPLTISKTGNAQLALKSGDGVALVTSHANFDDKGLLFHCAKVGSVGVVGSIIACPASSGGYHSQLRFYTASSGASNIYERMIIDKDGNIGIGITGPSYKLDVVGDINASGNIRQNGSALVSSQWATNGSTLYQQSYNIGIGNSSAFAPLTISKSGNVQLALKSGDGTALVTSHADFDDKGLLFHCAKVSSVGVVGSIIACPASSGGYHSQLRFYTAPSGASTIYERMMIDKDGNVGIGKTPGVQLDLSTDSARKLSTTTWSTGSDMRVKNDIQPADLDTCYSNVRNIPLHKFSWNSNIYPDTPDRNMLGWIAQEVEVVFPKSVQETNSYGFSNFKNLNSDQLLKCMYGALQKCMQKIEDQEARIVMLQNSLQQGI